jgi:excinuclease ABC subunit C
MQMSTKIVKKLKSLPTSPGVYIFYGASAQGGFRKAQILYVGKATSLKDRVGSYFQGRRGYTRPIEMFIDQIADIEVRKTETVLEAYILEQELIKKWQPKFNVDGKDDKSFVYVFVTKEEFPRFIIVRKRELDAHLTPTLSLVRRGSKMYGPYISKKNIEIALKILRKIFPYHSKAQKTEKGCLDFQIGLCPGPYAGAISKEDYAKNIRGIRMILEGKKKSLITKMKKEMSAYSEQQEFEKAGRVRNAIFALQHIRDVALISESRDGALPRLGDNGQREDEQDAAVLRLYRNGAKFRIEGYDISNISGKSSVGSMVVFDNANGEMQSNKSQYRKFKIKTVDGANDTASMAEVIGRRFGNNWTKPDLIILDGGQGHLTAVRRVLKNFHLEIPLLAVAKGPTRKKLDRYAFGSVPEITDEIIERIRDEAHRFAITYHKKLRKKSFME